LGAAALAGRVSASWSTLALDLAALIVMTALAATFIRTERIISRSEGAVAVTCYAVFTLITVIRG
ncbi:MAG TPA: calcium:sodium antiporter, partial [Polyangiaceae bacterium]|nr:calcium:sodium antiporter [Polyangiaceae bacterium]